jgi:pSer/pThr/pTyr-binding forkhead associated (FHA) protein
MARLIFTGEKFRGRVYEFALLKTTVGRGDHNTLAIHDASVSQTHCEVLVYGPEVIVRDLGSTNGTFVNGMRLRNQQRQIKPGETVRFGLVEARLELEQPSCSDTDTAETGFHSYARHLHDPEQEPINPALHSMTLDPSDSSPGAYTVALPDPSQIQKSITPPPPQKPET